MTISYSAFRLADLALRFLILKRLQGGTGVSPVDGATGMTDETSVPLLLGRSKQSGLSQCFGSLADLVERNARTNSDVEKIILAI